MLTGKTKPTIFNLSVRDKLSSQYSSDDRQSMTSIEISDNESIKLSKKQLRLPKKTIATEYFTIIFAT
jgi:hypothetical protein